MPPPVDPEPPPMNMSRSMNRRVAGVKAPMSSVERPPERGMTAAKALASTLVPRSWRPSVPGLAHSPSRIPTKPMPNSSPEVASVSLAWSVQRRGVRQRRTSTRITGKPREPTNTARAIGIENQGSAT